VQVLEAISVIAILVIVSVAALQFTFIMAVGQSVESAADEAAREAAKAQVQGGVFADTQNIAAGVVTDVLSVHGLSVDNTAGSGVRVIVEDGDNAGTFVSAGDATMTPDRAPPTAAGFAVAGHVRVTVLVSFDPTAVNPDVVPDALSSFGVGLAGRQYEVSSIAVKE